MLFHWYYTIAGLGIISLAYLSAIKAKRDGFFFWRTFFMSIVGFSGVVILFLTLID